MSGQGISWGKVIVGAAVVAGAVAVFAFEPELGAKILNGMKDMAATAYTAVGDAANWLWANIVGGADPKVVADAAAKTAHFEALQTTGESAATLAKGSDNFISKGLATLQKVFIDAQIPGAETSMKAAQEALEKSATGFLGFAIKNQAVAVGSAAVVGGGLAALGSAAHANVKRHSGHPQHSFTAREDMRKMQALMQARMAATGYSQAMMAQAQQGR